MKLSATAKVILGILRMGPRSGYEIKSLIDVSTSFFWTAAYGSIYPELRRLAERGLIEGTEDPAGDRRRVVYELTAEGHRLLEEWLAAEPATMELRDEPLLQLFFAGDDAEAAEALDRKAAMHAATAERLRGVEEKAASLQSPYPMVSLRYGLAFHEFARDWCEREADRLRRGG